MERLKKIGLTLILIGIITIIGLNIFVMFGMRLPSITSSSSFIGVLFGLGLFYVLIPMMIILIGIILLVYNFIKKKQLSKNSAYKGS